MLERYGIVTRETVLAEGVPGGFATLYAELGNLELLGTARRGYFVEGLGGAQFALPGAVERLRSLPDADGSYLLLAATDPANPYGASAALAETTRAAGAPAAPPAPACSSATASPRSSSSAAGAACCGCGRHGRERRSARRCGRSPRPSSPGSCRNWRSRNSTARR